MYLFVCASIIRTECALERLMVVQRRFAAFVYTPEGESIREHLWKETMGEFEFAEVQGILDNLKK
jgi:hypothetical protein